MARDSSRLCVLGLKLDSFVARKNFSRGWRFKAMPVARSDRPCT